MNLNPMNLEQSLVDEALRRASFAVREALKPVGTALSKEGFRATIEALTPFQRDNADVAKVTRDLTYGPDPRHVFDWFEPAKCDAASPPTIILFVHGGGFVGGDKREPDSPLYDNIGYWATANGLYAATITYRLAPTYPWPAAAVDIQQAIKAVTACVRNISDLAPRIFLMGHSAGAVHVASAITLPPPQVDVAGCILISGSYDNTVGTPNKAYFGEQQDLYPSQSSLPGLVHTTIPLFLAVAEGDPSSMHVQADAVMKARGDAKSPMPQFVVLDGNNHYSTMLLLNSVVDSLGPQLLGFIERGNH